MGGPAHDSRVHERICECFDLSYHFLYHVTYYIDASRSPAVLHDIAQGERLSGMRWIPILLEIVGPVFPERSTLAPF